MVLSRAEDVHDICLSHRRRNRGGGGGGGGQNSPPPNNLSKLTYKYLSLRVE